MIDMLVHQVHIHLHWHNFPQTVFAVGVLTVLYQRCLDRLVAPFAACALSFLCAGCVNSEGRVAPVWAKCAPAFVFAVKLSGFDTFSFKMASGALGVSGSLFGVSRWGH